MPGFFKKQKDKSPKSKYFFGILGVVFLVISGFLLVNNIKLYKKQKEISQELSKYESDIKNMGDSNKKLRERIDNYDDPEYIEKVAREEANMKKSGENVVSFVMQEDKEILSGNIQNNSLGANIWSSFTNFFKNIFK